VTCRIGHIAGRRRRLEGWGFQSENIPHFGRGKGKSGCYRTVHYFAGEDVPVLLLALINKGERANLSKAERNALRVELEGYADDYKKGAASKVAQIRKG
jgi:hypothetical protein